MRITNKQITSSYINNFNSSLENLYKLSNKVETGRKYQKASEDPASSLKAMLVRKDLSRTALYKNNINEVEGQLTEVESNISQINKIFSDAMIEILAGKSDTYTSNRSTIADVLRNCQAEIFSIANSKYSDKYIFGGTNTSAMPFKIEGGKLTYHGIDVDSNTGFTDEAVYYDIGIGLQTDVSGNVIEGTAFNISNPGSKIFGTGMDSDGISNNYYNLLGQIADKFDANDMTDIEKYITRLEGAVDKNMVNYVDVGQKTNFIDFLSSRFDADEINLTKKQKDIEGIDSAKAILDFKAQQTAYNAALQMGSNIIQMTLLNYMT